jgi:SAM-dependent methyltransferase
MKINIGSGDKKIEGFVTCDYDPLNNPDYLFNLETDRFPFKDNTVEAVVAHHVLEHLGEGYFHCLQELYRVCRHGALIDIVVPHPRSDAFLADPTHRRPITPLGLQLFSKKFNELCRVQNFSSSRLAEYYNVDFELLDYNYRPAKEYVNEFEGQPKELVEKYLNEHNNIINEIWIKLVVVKDGR